MFKKLWFNFRVRAINSLIKEGVCIMANVSFNKNDIFKCYANSDLTPCFFIIDNVDFVDWTNTKNVLFEKENTGD